MQPATPARTSMDSSTAGGQAVGVATLTEQIQQAIKDIEAETGSDEVIIIATAPMRAARGSRRAQRDRAHPHPGRLDWCIVWHDACMTDSPTMTADQLVAQAVDQYGWTELCRAMAKHPEHAARLERAAGGRDASFAEALIATSSDEERAEIRRALDAVQ